MGKSKYQGQKKYSKHKAKETFQEKEEEAADEAARLGISVEELLRKREEENAKRAEEEESEDSEEEKVPPAKKDGSNQGLDPRRSRQTQTGPDAGAEAETACTQGRG